MTQYDGLPSGKRMGIFDGVTSSIHRERRRVESEVRAHTRSEHIIVGPQSVQISVAESARPAVSRTGGHSAAPGVSAAFNPCALAIAAGLSMLMALAPGPGAHGADKYYRWKDERGRMVVSDRPPIGGAVDYEVVSMGSTTLVRQAPPGEGAPAPEREAAPGAPGPGREPPGGDTPQETMEVITRDPEICAQAQTNLKTLNTSARIRMRDRETGEPRFISEEEREIQRQKAQDTINVHCD